MYQNDERIVLTLDAGGTNFVFSAMQACEHIVEPLRLAAVTDDVERCLRTLAEGFREISKRLPKAASAISFAFPGPADYESGIIGDAPNFPAFRGGVALGPYLEAEFGVPVYINNDGHLFAYGEALAGMLPQINAEIKSAGGKRVFRNLIGITIGTGFGGGIVIDGCLLRGDNGVGADMYLLRGKDDPQIMAEESVSIRAVKRFYAEQSGDNTPLEPKDIFDIAEGVRAGNREAAAESFAKVGRAAGDAVGRAVNLVDGVVVVGGGVAGAAKYIIPAMVEELRSEVETLSGVKFSCVVPEVFNLYDDEHRKMFLQERDEMISVPLIGGEVLYKSHKKIGVGVSTLGTSQAIALGAYTYALAQLDKR